MVRRRAAQNRFRFSQRTIGFMKASQEPRKRSGTNGNVPTGPYILTPELARNYPNPNPCFRIDRPELLLRQQIEEAFMDLAQPFRLHGTPRAGQPARVNPLLNRNMS